MRGLAPCAGCLIWALAMLASPHADGADPKAAEALFQAAKKLADEGNWAQACPKFDASFELEAQLGTLVNLANCWEQLGRVATAWVRLNQALEWAQRIDDVDRIEWIKDHQSKVTPRLPKLIVRVQNPVPTLSVEQDGTIVPPPSWGIELPVDPGDVSIRVRRGSEILDERDVRAEEGKSSEVVLDLAAIDAAHPIAKSTQAPAGPLPPPPDQPREPYDPTQRNAGLGVGAVGLAAVLVAAGLEIGALVKRKQANEPDACQNRFCSPQGLDAAEQGALLAEVGQWVGVGGLVVLAVGVTVFLTAPSQDSAARQSTPRAALRIEPLVTRAAGGVSVGANW